MKQMAKINRGLILTVLVLVAVTIYLIMLSTSHNSAKPAIREICEKYVKTAVQYKMLPEAYRKEGSPMPAPELEKYISDMTRDIKSFYIDNEQTYKYIISGNKAELERQSKGSGIVYSYKKDIAEYKDFVFDGNTVTVTILSNTVYDGPDITTPGLQRANISTQTTDTITLQKTGNQWKLVYADLPQPMKNQNTNTVTTTVRYN